MPKDFPHISDTEFPIIDNVNPYKYRNDFDYSQYDKTQMTVTVCSVPWDVGLIHVGNAQISGLGNVVDFESKQARDDWFDSLDDKYTWQTKYREYHADGYIEVPLPYEKACLYNYVYVEYAKLPVDYADGGKDKFFFFIRSCESLAPSTCKIEILRDTWQTYIYDIDISYMMLERGHAPMALTDAATYLSSPAEHTSYLLADDVNYGGTYVSRRANEIVLNSDDMFACIVTCTNLVEDFGDFQDNTARTPNGRHMQDGQPAMFAYAIDPGDLSDFFNAVESNVPQFFQTVKGVFFISGRFITITGTLDFLGFGLGMVKQATATLDLVNLNKQLFGYADEYKDIAKLYTYPYAYIEISDESGNVNQVRIEETTGDISLTVTSSIAYPWIALDGRLSGIGLGGNSITFANVDSHTFEFSGDWYNHIRQWEIPTFAVNVSASTVYDYETYYERQQKRLEIETDYDNALLNADTAYANSNASADTANDNALRSISTAKDNADASADAAFENATRNADTAKTNSDASAETTYANTMRNVGTAKGNSDASADTTRDNALRNAATAKDNADAGADTTHGNTLRNISTAKDNADASANTTHDNALRNISTAKDNADASATTANENAHYSADASHLNAYTDADTAHANAYNSAGIAKQNAYNSADAAYQNAYNGADASYRNAYDSANADYNNTGRSALAARQNAYDIADTSKTNAYENADTAQVNAYRAANCAKSNYDNQRTLQYEETQMLTNDDYGGNTYGWNGYIGAQSYFQMEKLSDDWDEDWAYNTYSLGIQLQQTAMTTALNTASSVAASIGGGAVSGLVAGPGGAAVGAAGGLVSSAVQVANASVSVPMMAGFSQDMLQVTQSVGDNKTQHAQTFLSKSSDAQKALEYDKYASESNWLGQIADRNEATAKASADLLETTAQACADRNNTTDKANADRTYAAATDNASNTLSVNVTNAQRTRDTTKTNADNTESASKVNADNTESASKDNADNTESASKENADRNLDAAVTNADNTETTAKANALRDYNTDTTNANATWNTAKANALRNYNADSTNADDTRDTTKANALHNYDTDTANANATWNTTKANALRNYNADSNNAVDVYETAIDNNLRSYESDTANAANSKNTAKANAERNYNTDTANANATWVTAHENNVRTWETATSIASVNKDVANAAIDADVKQAGLKAPVQFGDYSNGGTSTTRPIGLFANVVTQAQDAIEQAGDYFLRFGYAVNRSWKFDGFNKMPKFTYWKASDMWIKGNNVPDAFLDEIRFFLFGGVCVWRKPEDIGNTSIYDN